MKQITVGFSRPKSWKPFAWLIMTAYGTPYDHVYIKFHSDSCQRDIIYQASKMMVNFVGTTVFESENIVVKEFKLQISDENYLALMQFAIDNAGKPYSMKEVLGLAWVRINAWVGRKIENPLKSGDSMWVCSIIADYIIQNFSEKKSSIDYEDMSPKDVYDLLSQ